MSNEIIEKISKEAGTDPYLKALADSLTPFICTAEVTAKVEIKSFADFAKHLRDTAKREANGNFCCLSDKQVERIFCQFYDVTKEEAAAMRSGISSSETPKEPYSNSQTFGNLEKNPGVRPVNFDLFDLLDS